MTKPTKGVQITISKDSAERLTFLRNFKHRLPTINEQIEASIMALVSTLEQKVGVQSGSWRLSRKCTKCSTGVLLVKVGKKPDSKPFYGCSKFPACKHTERVLDKLVNGK
jgi:hypothetical protein